MRGCVRSHRESKSMVLMEDMGRGGSVMQAVGAQCSSEGCAG
jgi:hypothetical protein